MVKHASVVLLLLTCTTAFPAEENLEFRFVTMPAEVHRLDAPNIPGQMVAANKMKGAAFFKDGRIATMDFVLVQDLNKGTGTMFGYTTYQFEEGSSIITRFDIKATSGQPIQGEYAVLSGTGKYAGVKGTGRFNGVPAKFEGAFLNSGSFKLTTP